MDIIKVGFHLNEKMKIKRLNPDDMGDSKWANFDNLAGIKYIIYVRW